MTQIPKPTAAKARDLHTLVGDSTIALEKYRHGCARIRNAGNQYQYDRPQLHDEPFDGGIV